MVVDTSVVLAVLFEEEHAAWAAEQLQRHRGELCMSTVNLTEVLIRLRSQQPELADELSEQVLTGGFRFEAPDTRQAELAAAARLRFPLNLGDCFAYALAIAEDCAILTTDADFRRLDCPILFPA